MILYNINSIVVKGSFRRFKINLEISNYLYFLVMDQDDFFLPSFFSETRNVLQLVIGPLFSLSLSFCILQIATLFTHLFFSLYFPLSTRLVVGLVLSSLDIWW